MKAALFRKVFVFLCASALFFSVKFSAFAQNVKPDALKEFRNGNYKEAIAICEEELKETPNNRESFVVLCWALVENGQYLEAEQVASRARALYTGDGRLIEILGEAKYFLQKYNEALELFQQYIAISSESASRLGRVYRYVGEIYIRDSKFNHADIALTMAVFIEPNMDVWWTRLGYAREQVAMRETVPEQKNEEYKSALVAYNKALELNSSQYDAQEGRKRCQRNL